jgi:hypothetical protein
VYREQTGGTRKQISLMSMSNHNAFSALKRLGADKCYTNTSLSAKRKITISAE